MLGTLWLITFLMKQNIAHAKYDAYIPCGTNNQGNSLAILNMKTKKFPCSAFLMELAWILQDGGALIGAHHTKRDLNKWADQLAGMDTTGFDPAKRFRFQNTPHQWQVIPLLLQAQGMTGTPNKPLEAVLPGTPHRLAHWPPRQ